MDDGNRPRVAVIGAGHRGRGWASLALSRGWPVSLYDSESSLLQKAGREVADRVRRLTDLGRADPLEAAGARASLVIGRSLLHAVGDAEPGARRDAGRSLHQATAARADRAGGRARRDRREPDRHHARELAGRAAPTPRPAPRRLRARSGGDRAAGRDRAGPAHRARRDPPGEGLVHALDRQPVVLQREVVGNASGRILAAVWRECIDLVLEGVVDLADVDRLVSRGPAAALAVPDRI